MAAMTADKSSHLETLLTAWGVQLQSGAKWSPTAATRCTVSMRQGEPPVQHLGILGLDGDSLRRRTM